MRRVVGFGLRFIARVDGAVLGSQPVANLKFKNPICHHLPRAVYAELNKGIRRVSAGGEQPAKRSEPIRHSGVNGQNITDLRRERCQTGVSIGPSTRRRSQSGPRDCQRCVF